MFPFNSHLNSKEILPHFHSRSVTKLIFYLKLLMQKVSLAILGTQSYNLCINIYNMDTQQAFII